LYISIVYCIWALIDAITYNNNGLFIPFTNVVGALLNAVELTLFRVVVLLVSLGYSITKPVLSNKVKSMFLVLTFSYLIIVAISNYISVLENASVPVNTFFQYFIVFLLSFTNTLFFLWIGYSAWMTVKSLKSKVHLEKYTMYRNLSMVLIGSLFCSVIFFIMQFIIEFIEREDDAFRVWWIFTLYWEFIYFIVIANVAYIWLPSQNNLRYAYEDVEVDLENQEGSNENPNDVSLEESQMKKKKKKEIIESSSSSSDKKEKKEKNKQTEETNDEIKLDD